MVPNVNQDYLTYQINCGDLSLREKLEYIKLVRKATGKRLYIVKETISGYGFYLIEEYPTVFLRIKIGHLANMNFYGKSPYSGFLQY